MKSPKEIPMKTIAPLLLAALAMPAAAETITVN